MEIRVLEYFLAIAREQNISKAAESLHLSQPTLSRQIQNLEEEIGKQLFIRGRRQITLTDEGMLLRKRAEEILNLVYKTENELNDALDTISGDIYIGTGETDAIRHIAKTARKIQKEYPDIHYHIISADSEDVLERLDKGLIDFGLIFGEVDYTKYNALTINTTDRWGVLMQKNSPLAKKNAIKAVDLIDKPIIISRQVLKHRDAFFKWFGKDINELNIISTYNLLFNASLMVEEGVGYALCIDRIINTSGESPLCFRPLAPALEENISIVWKKYQVFTKASEYFLKTQKAMKSEIF